MLSSSHCRVTTPPCTPSRCYCGATTSSDTSTTPKLASAVNVLTHAQSSHSGEGTAWASINKDDVWEDDFQIPYTPVCHIVRREDDSWGDPAEGRPESSRGSSGLWTGFQVDISEQEDMLETIDSMWRTTRWLQLVVQGISDDKVPWYEYVTPLMVGTEGMALSLAKCLLTLW